MYNDYNTKDIILKDTKNGKDTDWRGKKINSLELSNSYKRIGYENKSLRVGECGDYLEFRLAADDALKLTRANFCKVRLCPMCAWRRSLKIFGQVSKVMDCVEENYNYKYIFLTLTVKNCYGEDLKDTLDQMTKGFNKMTRRKQFETSIKGYFRSLEVTYNKEEDTYHPHFHLILAVNKSYFDDNRIYISQKGWTSLWQDCIGVDYIPIVDVRRLRKNKGKEVAEVAKYTVKSEDFIIRNDDRQLDEKLTDEVVKILDNALHRKRLVSFGFLFKDIHKKLNLDDSEDGDLTNTDNEDLREDLTDIILRYQWNIGIKNYKLVEIDKIKEE